MSTGMKMNNFYVTSTMPHHLVHCVRHRLKACALGRVGEDSIDIPSDGAWKDSNSDLKHVKEGELVVPSALKCTVLYCTVLYCTVLYCTVLYCTVLHCTVLSCTVL